jgi:hypothetical protein
VHGAKRFFSVLFLFSLSNTVLFLFAIVRAFSTDFAFSKLLYLFLVLVIGICFTIYAAYRTYQYVVIDTMRVVYGDLAPYFQKVSEHLVDKVAGTIQGKVGLSDEQLTKAMDLGNLINSKFTGTPRFLRKGIVLILKRIPIAGMLLDLKEELSMGNKQAVSAKLYTQVDSFISGSIFGKNNTNWVWWLLPVNVLVLLLLIGSKIG